jgi:osmotically-inducible protein OsmY
VRNITNDIEVFSDIEAADVTMLVQGALDRYALIRDDGEVAVDASDGTITLSGHVRTWPEHDAAIDAAWMGIGITGVRDDLVVTG